MADTLMTYGANSAGERSGPGLVFCTAARSMGYDPTMENAQECGEVAAMICEECGPLCADCASQICCPWGDHRPVEGECA